MPKTYEELSSELAEIEALLEKDGLIHKSDIKDGEALKLVRDLRNALADRRLFLKQRDELLHLREILFEVRMHGIDLPMPLDLKTTAEYLRERDYEIRKMRSRMREAEGNLAQIKSALNTFKTLVG